MTSLNRPVKRETGEIVKGRAIKPGDRVQDTVCASLVGTVLGVTVDGAIAVNWDSFEKRDDASIWPARDLRALASC